MPKPPIELPAPVSAANGRRRVLAALAGMSTLGHVAAPAAEPGFEWRPWAANRPVPPLDLPRLEGGRFRLADQRGKVVLVNFWASWCGPCRAEMPSLARLAAAHAGRGLMLMAVNYREAVPTIRRFIESLDFPVPVALDESGEAAKSWTPRVFPSTVLIDRRGRPAGVLLGELDWESSTALERVAPLLQSR